MKMEKVFNTVFKNDSVLFMALSCAAGVSLMTGGLILTVLSGVFIASIISLHIYGTYKGY